MVLGEQEIHPRVLHDTGLVGREWYDETGWRDFRRWNSEPDSNLVVLPVTPIPVWGVFEASLPVGSTSCVQPYKY